MQFTTISTENAKLIRAAAKPSSKYMELAQAIVEASAKEMNVQVSDVEVSPKATLQKLLREMEPDKSLQTVAGPFEFPDGTKLNENEYIFWLVPMASAPNRRGRPIGSRNSKRRAA